VAEIDGWLSNLHGTNNFPVNACKACNLAMKNSGSGTQTDYSIKLRLPSSLNTYKKTTLISSGWADLPRTVAPLSIPQEKDIIDALLSDLNGCFSFAFSTDVTVSREAITGTRTTGRKIVVVGASLAERLHDALTELGENTLHIRMPSWMPNNTTITAACEELERVTFNTSENNLIIFYNLDCAAYYARQVDGSLIPARQLDGHYHIDRELVVAPKELFTRTLKHCTPLLQLHPNIKKLVLSPTPLPAPLSSRADVSPQQRTKSTRCVQSCIAYKVCRDRKLSHVLEIIVIALILKLIILVFRYIVPANR
jgi:hypothetical protein